MQVNTLNVGKAGLVYTCIPESVILRLKGKETDASCYISEERKREKGERENERKQTVKGLTETKKS